MAARGVLVCSNSALGHARPMLAVARAFAERGWRVRVLTGAALADAVRESGAEHLLLPAEADVQVEAATAEHRPGLKALNEGAVTAFLGPAPAAWAAIRTALDAEPVDVVATDFTLVGAAGLAGLPEADRPFVVACGIAPLGLPSPDVPPFGLGLPPMRGPLNRPRNRLLTALATRVLLAPLHREVDRTFATFGAPPLEGRFFMEFLRPADLIAQFTVPEFEYPRRDPADHLRFYGPAARGGAAQPDRAALPEWWDRLDGSRPVVHVSQGTVANTDFGELVAPAFAALGREDVQIVVTTGGPPVDRLPPAPPNALLAPFVPHELLMGRTDVFVTNGGYGALHQAMAHGVPIVVAGDTEDKPETAARVAWSGAGVNLRTGRPRPEAIRRAVRRVLGDERFARASGRIGAAIRRSPGAAALVTDVERALDARS